MINTGMVSVRMFKRLPFEALIWLTALVILGVTEIDRTHFTLCPLQHAGFTSCPGCGLGRSVSLLFRGEMSASIAAHPLGIFAVIVLSFRILNLTKLYLKNYGKSY